MSLATEPRPDAVGIPRPIREALAGVRRRLLAASALRLFAAVAAVAAVVAVVGIAADLAFVLPPWARWALWGAWIASMGAALLAGLARGLGRSHSWDALAAVAERPHPEWAERLTAAVGLATRPANGSPDLIAALQDDAGRRAGTLDFRRAVPLKGPSRGAIAAGLMVAALLVPAAVRPDPFGILLARFVAPWSGLDRIGRFAIDVEPGDVATAPGDDLAVKARVRPRYGPPPAVDAVDLEWVDGLGKSHRARMKAEDQGFSASVPRLATSIRYRVVAAGSPSKRYTAEVVEPPSIASISADVEPPAYTNLPAAPSGDPSRLEAWKNSRITLRVRPDRAVRSLKIAHPNPEDPANPIETDLQPAPEGGPWTAVLDAIASGPYRFLLEDDRGLKNRRDADRRIVVRPDAPPTVALLGPESSKDEKARPDDLLRAEVAARDDLGLSALEVHYEIRPADPQAPPRSGFVAAPFAPEGATLARASASIDLRQLALRPGDTVSYKARAVDTLPPPEGPNEAWSDSRTLTVSGQAEPLASRRSAESRSELQAELDAVKKAAAENRRQTEPLRYAADAALRGNGRWDEARDRELAAREPAAADVADRLEQLARDLEADPRFAPLAEPARQVARVEAEAGREALADARRDNDPAKRLADLQKADNRQAAVQARLDDLQRQFDALAKSDGDRQKLDDLARRQDDLARRAAEMAGQVAPDRARLDQAQAEQERLRRELADLLKKSPALKAEALARRAREADDLVRKARDLAARQRDEARGTVEFPRDDPRFRALAEAQRQVEDDARRLALDIDAPLLENGRGKLNTALLANAVEPLRRGDLEQSRQRLEEAENDLRRVAGEIDDLRNDPRAFARRLARRQDEVSNRAVEALRPVQKPADNPDDRADMAKRLEPLRDRQAAINRQLASIPAEEPPAREALERARQAADRADQALKDEPNPRQVEARQREAVQALNRLAETLPDPNKRRDLARQKAGEAHRKADEAARHIEQALRETGPQPGKPYDRRQADADLARRLEPPAARLAESLAALEAMPAESRVEPQRARSLGRTRALQDAVKRLRDSAGHPEKADQARDARESLRPLATDARAAAARLDQKALGRVPADEVAEALADDARRAENLPPDSRLANALRNLEAPEAATLKAEAIRLAQLAAQEGDPDRRREASRQAADAAEALADRLNDRLPANREAATLAEAARVLDAQARQGTVDPQSLANRQRAIADASIRLDDREARQASGQAAELAERAAGLAHEGPEPTPIERANARAAAIAALDAAARREAPREAEAPANLSPRALAEALARRQHALAERAAREPGRLEQAQRDLSRALASIPENRPDDDLARKEADGHRQAAREAQEKAAGAMAARDDRAARDEAARAAVSLERLAQVLPGAAGSPSPLANDPALTLDPARSRDVRELAGRERQIRETLQSLLGGRADAQERLRDQSAVLGRELARIRDATREISPRAHEPARQGAELLSNQAPRAMEQGAENLAQGRPDPARDAQRRAADLAEQAAHRAEDLAAALRADMPPEAGKGRNEDEGARQGLAEAEAAQDRAAQELAQARDPGQGSKATQAAALAMKEAAEALQAAAQMPGNEPAPEPSDAVAQRPANAEPKPGEIGRTDADLAQLQQVLKSRTGRAWGDLPGHLRTELLQMSQGRYRDDYARLIQLYFREIATASPERKGPAVPRP
ncbi:MAG: hypothetical protein U0800_07655 [Isosphaeraceae bacterium]